MTSWHDMAREFHLAFGIPVVDTPGLPDEHRRALRIRLLKEEMLEYIESEEQDSITEIADALADIVYIVCGTALEYGIPLEAVFEEVHRSNMSKLDSDGKPIIREDGKVLKGPNYFRPDIFQVLFANAIKKDELP